MNKNIPSIYNYCDRWCVRCPLTSRCTVYESEKKMGGFPTDARDPAFWDRISDNLKKGLDLLGKTAARFGIDINEISGEELDEITRQEKEKKRVLSESSLSRLSLSYSRRATDLLRDQDFWMEAGAGMIASLRKDSVEEATANEAGRILEFREVIGWYSLFIHLKFERALGSRIDERQFDELYGNGEPHLNPYQRDANGSAKIALIAVQRSIEAWSGLLELVPDEEQINPLLSLLRKIEREARAEFPHAEAFVRPGFDTGE